MIVNLRKSLDEARAQGAGDADLIASLVDLARSTPGGVELLTATYRDAVTKNRTDVSAAFERALFPAAPSESRAVQVGKSIGNADTLAGAIGSALAHPVRATAGRASILDGKTPTKKSATVAALHAGDAAEVEKARERASKVRRDVLSPGPKGSS